MSLNLAKQDYLREVATKLTNAEFGLQGIQKD